MKTIQILALLAVLLGASDLVTADTTEAVPIPRESVNNTATGNKVDSKWILAGLLGLLVLFGMRHNRHDHRPDTSNHEPK